MLLQKPTEQNSPIKTLTKFTNSQIYKQTTVSMEKRGLTEEDLFNPQIPSDLVKKS
jgi:hypothetical protein